MRARLLSISDNRTVLQTRHLILQQAGFDVVSVADMQELTGALAQGEFDLFILGHSLPAKEKLRVYHLVQGHSQATPVLELYKFSPDLNTGYALSSQGEPQALIDAGHQALGYPGESQRKSS